MTKYIDAGKLIAEIERLKKRAEHLEEISLTDSERSYWSGESGSLELLTASITSLQQEQPDVDLEKEIDSFLKEAGAPFIWCNDDEQMEWCSIIARHFWNKGYNAKKEETKKK